MPGQDGGSIFGRAAVQQAFAPTLRFRPAATRGAGGVADVACKRASGRAPRLTLMSGQRARRSTGSLPRPQRHGVRVGEAKNSLLRKISPGGRMGGQGRANQAVAVAVSAQKRWMASSTSPCRTTVASLPR